MNGNLQTLFNNSKSLLIVVAKQAKLDAVAAALGLQLAAIAQGKSARVCTETVVTGADKLVGADSISKTLELGGNVLKVSFPYRDGNIDKVTYNITDDRFNLLVEPKTGTQPLDSKEVQYSYTGGQIDLIITIDAPNLEALGDLYLENPDVFTRDKIVNLDRRFDNQQYGVENIVEKQYSSTSEIVAKLLENLRWDINPDIATNLYAGLVVATNNFTSFSTNAQSFEVASYLLKNGARKIPVTASRPGMPGTAGMPATQMGGGQVPQGFGRFNPPAQSVPPKQSQSVFQQPQEQKPEKPAEKKQPPQDWLKPKIFKSTDLI